MDKPVQNLSIEMIKYKLSGQGAKELGPKHYEKIRNIEDQLNALVDLILVRV